MKMKAAVWTDYGVMALQQVDMPVIGDDELLVRVKAAGLCITDLHVYTGKFSYARPPHVLGHEIAGEIVEMGKNVRGLHVGGRVAVETSIGCGHCRLCKSGMRHLCTEMTEIGFPPHGGGYAEYVKLPAENAIPLPDEMSDDEAGIMESVVCPMGALMRNGVRMGETVVVFGVGPAGIAFIQGVKALGAGKVIAVGRNTQRLERARDFGADVLIDSSREDVLARVLEENGGTGADLVCEAAGVSSTIRDAFRIVRWAGRVILYGIPLDSDKMDFPIREIITGQLEVHGAVGEPRVWEPLIRQVVAGKINLKGMITHTMPLEQINEAMHILEEKSENPIKIVIKP